MSTTKKIIISFITTIITTISVAVLWNEPNSTPEIIGPSFVMKSPAVIATQPEVSAEGHEALTDAFCEPEVEEEAIVRTSSIREDPKPEPVSEPVSEPIVEEIIAEPALPVDTVEPVQPEQPITVDTSDVEQPVEQSVGESISEYTSDEEVVSEPEEELYTDECWFRNLVYSDNLYTGAIVNWNCGYNEKQDLMIQKGVGMAPQIVADTLFDAGLTITVDDLDTFSTLTPLGYDAAGCCDFEATVDTSLMPIPPKAERGVVEMKRDLIRGGIHFPNDPDLIAYSIVHEMGHALAEWVSTYQYVSADGIYYSVNADRTDEFVDIYNRERNNGLIREYGCQSSVEFFADCFQYYCTDPGALMDNCPETYGYIDRIVESLYTNDYNYMTIDLNQIFVGGR